MKFRISIRGFLVFLQENPRLYWNTHEGMLKMISRELGHDRYHGLCADMIDPDVEPEIVIEYAGLRNGEPSSEFIDRMSALWRRVKTDGIPVTFREMADPASV